MQHLKISNKTRMWTIYFSSPHLHDLRW